MSSSHMFPSPLQSHCPHHFPIMTSLEEARAVVLGEIATPEVVEISPQRNRECSTQALEHTRGEYCEARHSATLGDNMFYQNQQDTLDQRDPFEQGKSEDHIAPEQIDSAHDQHHRAGFSAEAFADYERRLNAPPTLKHVASTSIVSICDSKDSFEKSNILENGLASTITLPARTHSKHPSTSTVATVSTLYTLNVPEKRQSRVIRNMRHTTFNVYRRLFSIVFIANMIAFIIMLGTMRTVGELSLSNLATAASANFTVAILIRQDYIVNFLFRTCWLIPHSAPLRLRRMLAKVYENGGVHSGTAVAGTVWFILLTVVVTIQFVQQALRSIPILTLTYCLITLLCAIIFFAYPRFRFMSHNTFEYSHRFAGWTAIGIFWAELALLTSHFSAATGQSYSDSLIRLPTFWFLIVITFHLVLPWLRLRKWHFSPDQLSNHALRLNFDKTLSPLSGLAISESPLREWHPFATFPKPGGGGSMIISSAGDWTKKTVLDPKTRYWVKGVPKTGVLSMAFVFKRVVVVTTGSGIGPCLSFLLEPSRKTTCRVLWSTPAPLKTYGHEICNSVREADPDAVIIDTRVSGRPDMIAATYNLFIESGAEAVFCISNPAMTRRIIYSMETRGIPAFGPIWDS
jgi:hypothetical protein